MSKAKKTGTALVKWDEELAKLAKETSKGLQQASEGKFLSFRGGRLSFMGNEVPDNELECVIVGWTNHNAFYGHDYDPDHPQPPVCYAFGQEPDEMAPHEASSDKQNDACASCPLNQFESAEKGKGKACKNTYRLALIASSDLEELDEAEVVYASIPPMSLKNFTNYLRKDLSKLERPHWSVVTKIKVIPDSKSQFKITFDLVDKIEDAELFGPLKALWQKTMEDIGFPYPERREEEEPKKRTKPAKFARR